MAGKHRAQTWWERQGYAGNHSVHSDGTQMYERDYADEFEGEVEHERTMAARGGPVSLSYNPTRTSNPGRPRTLAAGYDGGTDVLTIVVREGAVYEYYGVTGMQWQRFKRSASPGKFLNRVLSDKDYLRIQ